MEEARSIIQQIPLDKRIILEAGTPLVKAHGLRAIKMIRNFWEERIFGPQIQTQKVKWLEILEKSFKEKTTKKEFTFTPYIVADLKCMDRGEREVEIARRRGKWGSCFGSGSH